MHNAENISYQLEDAAKNIWNVPVGIPEYDEIDVEIIKSNMRTVNMSREEYFGLLEKL